MTVFLGFLAVLATAFELVSLFVGLKHVRFDYMPKRLQAEPGEEIPVQIRATNVGILPVSDLRAQVSFPLMTQFEEGAPVQENRLDKTLSVRFRLWGRKQVTQTVPIKICKRGIHFFNGATLQRGDFLGLYQVPGEYTAQKEVLVYPKLLEDKKLLDALGSYCGDVLAQRHLIRDPIFSSGVREYTGREAMKTISWTHTARKGQLMTREFDFTREFSCVVLLATDELHPKKVDLLDTGCSLVRTVCKELTDRGIHVDFYTNCGRWSWTRDTRRIWNCSVGTDQMQDLLEGLARMYVSARCPAQELAATAVRSASMEMAFVLIATEDNGQIRRAMDILQEKSGQKTLLLLAKDYEEVSYDRTLQADL